MMDPNSKNTDKNKQALDKKDGMAQPINKPGEEQVIEKQSKDGGGGVNVRSPDTDKNKKDSHS